MIQPFQEHLACFLPGTLALGYIAGLQLDHHLKMAANLTRTCYEMYRRMPTGLSPEVAHMNIHDAFSDDINTGVRALCPLIWTISSQYVSMEVTGLDYTK